MKVLRSLAWFVVAMIGLQGPVGRADARAAATGDGLDAAAVARIESEIAGGKFGNVDSLLILRHGKVVVDRTYDHDYRAIYGNQAKTTSPMNAHDPGGPYNYFNPWWHPYYRNGGELHSEQSVTKTVASIVIGVATTRGEFPPLDTPVLKYFDEGTVANVDDRKRRLTIRNLITMTVGMHWNMDVPYGHPDNSATAMEASSDWVKYFIDQPMQEEPGARFYYNDGAPQALAHVFRVATGQDMEEYAAEHLFRPLGIKRWFWKRTPQGLPDSEGGLYLERHDLAKLMLLFQHGGLWQGERVVSADWVRASIAPAATVNEKAGVKYGYLWWLFPYADGDPRMAFGGSGFGGQSPVVMPDYDIVIVVNAWNILDHPDQGKQKLFQRIMTTVVNGSVVR
jgi:hypothetical protein